MKAASISNGNGSDNKEMQDHISRLPQDCLMTVMKLTSPKDACRSAAVCTTFQLAADSDDLWQSFLPADLSSIINRAETDVQLLPVSKKELYLHLCHNWILLEGRTKVIL
ncbi:F-box protein [Carex littledalei]|uniref:F-box protein n=1 Tax=Carex littledalei TaxID=544730 RepID=A0A833QTM1_9POAL|nr:F-box protein [Carex littledalei]